MSCEITEVTELIGKVEIEKMELSDADASGVE